MRIGFYFECFKKSGGVYQIALNHLEVLRGISNHEFVLFNISPDFPYADFKNLPNWKIIDTVKFSSIEGQTQNKQAPKMRLDYLLKRKLILFVIETLRFFHLYWLENFLARFKAKKRAKIFDGHNLDLLLFHGPAELSIYTKIPSVVIIHDLHHKLTPEFPEMSKLGQWSKREYLYSHLDKNAFRIYVDSEVGKADIVRLYGVDPKKIVPLPPLPPPYIKTEVSEEEKKEVKQKYDLPDRFLFYPAQFWPHKNHFNLVKAVKLLKDRGVVVPLILVGSRQELWGEYERVVELVQTSGLEGQVKILGYVPIEDMSALYKLASGLAMPMYVGWTYVPIVEAWAMGCPIIYSTAHGCPEQGGDAAIYVDPYKSEDIAEKINQFWNDSSLRAQLVQNGYKKLALWTKSDFARTIKKTINDFEQERKRTS
ncbi:MAG: hypothetical protein A2664_00750 [Candidatus Taylorbacteria bacterium RIFCSPHIGHO2_01_FULL_46_22b]|uniref:Glycosyl transferase family 1 domain-containing protein n=1 Tax=Candidatus Taylorbacteria bacterium RIFCSPHIGHO2_01_FULL_46_22b TaxID=1802301 RepID=A0A1G2M3K6_9BACT|nr:MAG: hypothetical protein A2664_00750 [Candidatus Taylorbacteria bacterium RIFCSPHIGHO2_01_FULL_46_22b]